MNDEICHHQMEKPAGLELSTMLQAKTTRFFHSLPNDDRLCRTSSAMPPLDSQYSNIACSHCFRVHFLPCESF